MGERMSRAHCPRWCCRHCVMERHGLAAWGPHRAGAPVWTGTNVATQHCPGHLRCWANRMVTVDGSQGAQPWQMGTGPSLSRLPGPKPANQRLREQRRPRNRQPVTGSFLSEEADIPFCGPSLGSVGPPGPADVWRPGGAGLTSARTSPRPVSGPCTSEGEVSSPVPLVPTC